MSELFIELLSEEIPYWLQKNIVEQLEKKITDLLKNIIELKLLKKNWIIIIHRHKKEKDNFPIKFNILLEKHYGISKIIFGN